MSESDRQSGSDGTVTIEVPAQAEYVAVLRAAAGVIASRLEFSLDDIDDLRIVIDEAASLLLSSGAQGVLHCEISNEGETIHLRLRGRLPDGQEPHGEGFAWSILRALAHEVSSDVENGEHVVAASRSRGPVLDSAF